MAKFMLFAGGADVDKRVGNPKFAPVMFERYMAWIQGLRDSGRYVGSYKLYDQTGRRLTIRSGEVIDGPFIESKDAVGGSFIIERPPWMRRLRSRDCAPASVCKTGTWKCAS